MPKYRVKCSGCRVETEKAMTYSEFDRFKAERGRVWLDLSGCKECGWSLQLVPSRFTFTGDF